MVPSIMNLELEMQELIINALETHSAFNLAQMLQGENTPCQVKALQAIVRDQGEDHLKFYLFGVVGVMSALMATTNTDGSVFMNETNGKNVLLGIKCLQSL